LENDKQTPDNVGDEVETTSNVHRSPRQTLFVVLVPIAAVLVLALLLSLLVHKTVSYELVVPRDTVVAEPYHYSVTNTWAQNGFRLGFGIVAEANVQIENMDDDPGAFGVNFTFTTLNRVFVTSSKVYVVPGETKIATGMADVSLGEDWKWRYEVVPPTRNVTHNISVRETHYQRLTLFQWIFGLWHQV